MLTNQNDLQSLSIEELFEIYREEVDPDATREEMADIYSFHLHKGRFPKSKKYAENIEQMRQNLIYDIAEGAGSAIEQNRPQIPLPTKTFQPAPQVDWNKPTFDDLSPLDGSDNIGDLTNNVDFKKLPYKGETLQLSLQNQELERENKRLRNQIKEMAKKLKPLDKNAAYHLRVKEKAPAETWRANVDKERKAFRKAHHNMNYNEYTEAVKNSTALIGKLTADLKEDKKAWEVDFLQYKPEDLDEIKTLLVDWWKNKIGDLAANDKYKLQFRIKGDWKTVTLKDFYSQMLEKLEKGSFIYDMEKMPTFEYEAGKQITELPEWSLFDAIRIVPVVRYNGVNKDNGGHFFKYLANSDLRPEILETLTKLQIFTTLTLDGKTQRPELDDNCFIYAVKQTGKFTEEQLNLMRMRVRSRYLSLKSINEIANEFKFGVNVHRINLEAAGHHKKESFFIGDKTATPEMTFNFDLYDEHYMIHIDRTPFSIDYIKHIDDAPADAMQKRYRSKRGKYVWESCREQSYFCSSDKLILELMRQNKFTPITYATASIMKTTLYENAKDVEFPLEYDENACTKLIKPRTKKAADDDDEPSFWYADFEADTSGEIHKPFMCCVQSADGETAKTFKGPECSRFFLDFLPNNAVCYFHNFAYDWCMFNRLATTIEKVIKKGSKVYEAKIRFHGKHLTFKDSYAVFMCKLEKLPESFHLDGIKKELFPYKYYTLSRLTTNVGVVSEAGENEDKRWEASDYKTFNDNIDAIEGCRLDENTFDMYKYAEFYCAQDIRILRESFEKLCDGFEKEFGVDVKSKLTTPAIADEYFRRQVYEPNGKLYEVGGHVREFMARAIYGGRCMCAFNKKWHTTKKICDYDAVSLYPSAMRRLWTVEGKPEVLQVPDVNRVWTTLPDYLEPYNTANGVGAFVAEIKITEVRKHYAFPLIVQHTDEGNLNDDTGINELHPVLMVVDNIALEDLINFQCISFQVLKGYVWKGQRDKRVQAVIQKVFDGRRRYQDEKNPLEQLYKLVMNSAYGKTIQKPVDFDLTLPELAN